MGIVGVGWRKKTKRRACCVLGVRRDGHDAVAHSRESFPPPLPIPHYNPTFLYSSM